MIGRIKARWVRRLAIVALVVPVAFLYLAYFLAYAIGQTIFTLIDDVTESWSE